MVTAIKKTVTVVTDGVIEIRADELKVGDRAEIIVLLNENPEADPAPPERTMSSMLGIGKGSFKSIEEIDAYIREERDWGDRDPDA